MAKEWIEYQCEGRSFKGYLSFNEEDAKPKPAILIAHAWMGQDDFARRKADDLAEIGYAAFAADLYGDGKTVQTAEEAAALMTPLFIDRKALRGRIVAAYETLSKLKWTDPSKIGAIGFCFGGLTVLELLRSGVKLAGVVSFHGLLGDTLGGKKATLLPPAAKLYGSLLILHGYKDPSVKREDIVQVQKEFSDAKVDWQMHIYGDASHAFTNPSANSPEMGLMYHPKTEQRSLKSMQNFFSEVFE